MYYDDVNLGYFGLLVEYYMYFILLIRCYFDLIVYCLICKYLIEKLMDNKEVKCWEDKLFELVEYIFKCECCVIEVECDIDELKKVEYMI